MTPENAGESGIKTAVRVFRIIESIRDLHGATLTELADATGIPKSTLHAYLSTLEELEYVDREAGAYDLSLRFLDLGIYTQGRVGMHAEAEPVLNKLARECEEVVWLSVEDRGHVVYLDTARDAISVGMAAHVGKRDYMHCTAAGKAILARLPEPRVEEILEIHGLPELTPHTITDPDDLVAELDSCRERGYATSREERTEGIYAIGAPVVVEGTVLGSVTVAAPANRINWSAREAEIVRQVRGATDEIALNLRYP